MSTIRRDTTPVPGNAGHAGASQESPKTTSTQNTDGPLESSRAASESHDTFSGEGAPQRRPTQEPLRRPTSPQDALAPAVAGSVGSASGLNLRRNTNTSLGAPSGLHEEAGSIAEKPVDAQYDEYRFVLAQDTTPLYNEGHWQGNTLLEGITQVDGNDATVYDDTRCAAQSMVGAAMISGPDAVKTLAQNMRSAYRRDAQKLGARDDLSPREEQRLNNLQTREKILQGITSRVDTQNVTVDDMHLLAEQYYAIFGDSSGTDHTVIPRMMERAGFQKVSNPDPGNISLGADEYAVLRVDTDGDNTANHAAVCTYDAQSDQLVIYDPWPRSDESQLIYQNDEPERFRSYMGNSAGANHIYRFGRD